MCAKIASEIAATQCPPSAACLRLEVLPMNDPCPHVLPSSPLQLISAKTLFASGKRVRRHFGGLHALPSGRLILTFMFGTMPRTNDAGTMIATSDDLGERWSDPR